MISTLSFEMVASAIKVADLHIFIQMSTKRSSVVILGILDKIGLSQIQRKLFQNPNLCASWISVIFINSSLLVVTFMHTHKYNSLYVYLNIFLIFYTYLCSELNSS